MHKLRHTRSERRSEQEQPLQHEQPLHHYNRINKTYCRHLMPKGHAYKLPECKKMIRSLVSYIQSCR